MAAGPAAARGWAFDAVIFDMDGVVTDTAAVHARAWAQMFNEFLLRRAGMNGEAFREFSLEVDYRTHVDGKPRYQGVAAFLASRGLDMAQGTVVDSPNCETICGLGNRKNELFNQRIESDGVEIYESTVEFIRLLRAAGRKVGLATSSRNSASVLARTTVAPLLDTIVDGLVSERRGLQGKPSPDIFLAAASDLDVTPPRAVVVEDAVSGVLAGVAGCFGLVVGLARDGNAAALHAAGADLVVTDLAELDLVTLNQKIRLPGTGV